MQKKKEKTNKRKGVLATFLSMAIFTLCCIGTLWFSEQKNQQNIATEQKTDNIPYKKAPENKNVCFVFWQNDALILALDFEEERIHAVFVDNYSSEQSTYLGYPCDYTVELDYLTVCNIIDRLGAIELETPEGDMRCTGVQVQQMLEQTEEPHELKKEIILKLFEQIYKKGFAKDDVLYIIENSVTNLSVVDCFYWHEYLPKMATRINFVN